MKREYPMTLGEFENKFNTEEACRDYLFSLRWPKGFICPKCSNTKAWKVRTVLLECSKCHYQTSVIAGTIFQDTRKPLTMWFKGNMVGNITKEWIECIRTAKNTGSKKLRDCLDMAS